MVAENFDASLKRVLVHEGGCSNDRNDRWRRDLSPHIALRMRATCCPNLYRRRCGLFLGGSVPVIVRYHAASDCCSALAAARSDCPR